MTTFDETRDAIANRPKHMPTNGMPVAVSGELSVSVTQDGRVTVATAYLAGVPVAAGVAKRHPLDARNPVLGQSLALARLFQNLAEFYVGEVDRRLHRPVEDDPSAAAVKALRKGNRAIARAAHDEKRREARERFKREASQQHDASPAEQDAWRARTFGDWEGNPT